MDPQKSSTDLVVVNRLFMALHGYFGNQFFDKFRTGQTMQDGSDVGVENAKAVWGRELADYSPETIRLALTAVREKGSAFAPSLPEFIDCCRAHKPRQFAPPVLPNRTPPSAKAKAEFEEAMARLRVRNSKGFAGLLANCARAVALAGGDETQTLRGLERDFLR